MANLFNKFFVYKYVTVETNDKGKFDVKVKDKIYIMGEGGVEFFDLEVVDIQDNYLVVTNNVSKRPFIMKFNEIEVIKAN